MSLPGKAFSLDEDGRVRINRAASKVKHAQITIDTGQPQYALSAGLAIRRVLIVKPVRSGTDPNRKRVYIEIGPTGFTLGEGTPVFEEYELILNVGPDLSIYATVGENVENRATAEIDVRLLELGED